MEIILTLIGTLAGGAITHWYDRRSMNDLKQVEQNLKNDNKILIEEFRKLSEKIQPTQPETAKEIESIIEKHGSGPGAEPTVIGDMDVCPSCQKDTLQFINFGVGPLGVNNAWYGCTECKYKFQTNESSED